MSQENHTFNAFLDEPAWIFPELFVGGVASAAVGVTLYIRDYVPDQKQRFEQLQQTHSYQGQQGVTASSTELQSQGWQQLEVAGAGTGVGALVGLSCLAVRLVAFKTK